jgi:DNA-binding transcriptional regulator PaaX
MESAEIRSEATAAALDATVLAALTDQWERVGEVAARVEYGQRPTVRSALWRLMKDGHIDADISANRWRLSWRRRAKLRSATSV